jgi:O-antigen/teichoic acid export membrane protein
MLYNPEIGVGYIFISNLIASTVKMLLLLPMLKGVTNGVDRELLKRMMRYSIPMVVIGFAGIINEMLDRAILKYLLPFDNETNMQQLGIYGACYKLAVLMTLFIQAFRYAAEPFFFAQAKQENSKQIYADVMKYFVIVCVFVFLLVMLYLPWIQHFIGEEYRVGLPVVPILLMANLFLGIYVNLSIWYKLTDRTLTGAWVSIAGAVLTIILNVVLVPTIGYMGSAWATLACYAGMALVSYGLGQKFYPVQYDLKKITGYILLGLALWVAYDWLRVTVTFIPFWAWGSLLLLLFTGVVFMLDVKGLLNRTVKSASV